MTNLRVSVVIPVLNAGRFLPSLYESLMAQRPEPPSEIILVDSNSTDDTREVAARYENIRVAPIAKFSHGAARNLGARETSGDIVALMTQDALPQDNTWLRRLIEPFSNPDVGAVFSRQIPRPDASPMEQYFLFTRFPPGEKQVKRKTEGEELSFQNVFFSNVSSAVRRDILMDIPFDESLIMSEDQQLARDMIAAGYAIVYAPDSVVIHSHNYTLKVVFQRYFDSVYSLTVIFPKHGMATSASIGLRYLLGECATILRKHPATFPYYILYTIAKAGGTVAGHFARRMPKSWLRKLSLHDYHW